MIHVPTEFELIKPHHESGKGIYAVSKPCKPRKIAALADSMVAWLNRTNGNFKGNFSEAFAVSHCQVELTEPFAFFVVASTLIESSDGMVGTNSYKNFYFPAQAVFNPEILVAEKTVLKPVPVREISTNPTTGKEEMRVAIEQRPTDNTMWVDEACMSWPHRTAKKMERIARIKVRYQYFRTYPVIGRVLRSKTEWVEGLKAHIFQHECDHMAGKNIFFKS